MEPFSRADSLTNNLETQRDSQPVLTIERVFNAPVEHLWRAWSDVALMKQWWGPATFTCPSAELYFREGGRYNFAMKSPEGEVLWSNGVFEQIVPLETIVYTDNFGDENGNVITPQQAGQMTFENEWGNPCLVTLDFEKIGDQQSRLILSHAGIPAELHSDCTQGWNSSLDKLKNLIERN